MEPGDAVVVRPMRPEDAAAVRRVQYEGWRDTYVHPEGLGVEQLEELWRPRLSPQGIADYAAQVRERASRPEMVQLVAQVDGAVVGSLNGGLPPDGPQEIRVLYVATGARGRGVGSALMEAFLAGADPARPVSLGVATFNEGANRFYRRYGFEEVPGSQTLWNGVLAEVTMTRPVREEKRAVGGWNRDAPAP